MVDERAEDEIVELTDKDQKVTDDSTEKPDDSVALEGVEIESIHGNSIEPSSPFPLVEKSEEAPIVFEQASQHAADASIRADDTDEAEEEIDENDSGVTATPIRSITGEHTAINLADYEQEEIIDDDELIEEAEDLGTPEHVFDEVDYQHVDPDVDIEIEDGSSLTSDDEEIEVYTENDALEDSAEEDAEVLAEHELEEVVVRPPKATQSFPHSSGMSQLGKPIRRRKRKRREWWRTIFDDLYLALLPEVSKRSVRRELDFIEKALSLKKNSLVLDIACGQGGQAIGMSSRGYRVVGVDLSLPMLAHAGDAARKIGQNINFIHGDMRDLGFEQTFDGVYCVGTSFGYFDDPTNYRVLEGICRALKPGAPFLLEIPNRDYAIDKHPNLTWFEGEGIVCMEESEFNFLTSRVQLTRQIIFGETAKQVKHEYSIRLYALHELGQMLHRAGLVVTSISGHTGTPEAFFGADSTNLIIVAKRK